MDVRLTSFGYYNEPELSIKVDLEGLLRDGHHEYLAVLDAQTNKWELVLIHNSEKDMIGTAEFK